MILLKWEMLPDNMKTEPVKKYYDILKKKSFSLFIKRGFDLIVSLIMAVVLSPVLLILAILIKADSPGPVFYRQSRITTFGKPFRIFKFRTMVQNADKIGALVTVEKDPRITRMGSKIRKCRLDELPQIFNIITGDMSFVGTRPEVKKYVDRYSDEMMATLLMPAGVTSLASITYKDEDEIMARHIADGTDTDEAYVKYVLPEKMRYNLQYIENFSFFGDIKLMFKTIVSVLK